MKPFNDALDFYNRYQRRLMLEKKPKKESENVQDKSLSVLSDFEDIDYGNKIM